MFLYTAFMSIVVLFTKDKNSIENIVVSGKITCDGEPVEKVQITMLDDNIGPFDHILNIRETDKYGKFQLNGSPNDKDLDLLLIVEHSCHENRNTKTWLKIESYSTYRIPLHTLEDNDYNLEYNIELRENDGVYSSRPGLWILKGAAFVKTGFTDNANRFKEMLQNL